VAGLAAVGAAGAVIVDKLGGGDNPDDWYIPDVPVGQVSLETRHSTARGRDVEFFTAVPAGLGDGAGLPVCLVLHGASGRPSDYSRFGFPQLLTDAVQRGVEPFVLAGADGGSQSWLPVGADNPQEMLVYEVPDWLEERGFDSHRLVGWGWSMGGYGVVRLGEDQPGVVGAIAAFSPTVTAVDSVSTDMIGAGYLGTRTAPLSGTPIGIWCGTADPLYPAVQDLVKALPEPLAAGSYQAGAEHTRTYWNSITPAAFDFLGGQLARMAPPPPG
jgi:predicted esterase